MGVTNSNNGGNAALNGSISRWCCSAEENPAMISAVLDHWSFSKLGG
jgi:hypothetical protein